MLLVFISELAPAAAQSPGLAVIVNPFWRFFRGMIIKRGYLDGWRGLAFHLVEARYVQEKYGSDNVCQIGGSTLME